MDKAQQRKRIYTVNNPTAPRLCPELAVEIGLNESVLLLQIEHWISICNHPIDGDWWTYQSVRDIKDTFPFWGLATINRTIESLEKKNLIKIGNFNQARYDRTRWFAINGDEINRTLKSIKYENGTGVFQNGTRLAQIGTQSNQNGTTIPESTTEITTEIIPPMAETPNPEKQSPSSDEEFYSLPSASAGMSDNPRSAETADPIANREAHVDDVAKELILLTGGDHKTTLAAKKLLADYNNPMAIIHAIQEMRADDRQRTFAQKAGAMAARDSILTIAKRKASTVDKTAELMAEAMTR